MADVPEDFVHYNLTGGPPSGPPEKRHGEVPDLDTLRAAVPKAAPKMEDVISHQKPKGLGGRISYALQYKTKTYFLRNKKRNLKRWVGFGLLFIVLASVAIAGVFISGKLHKLGPGNPDDFNPNQTFKQEEEEEIDYGEIFDITNARDLEELLYQWAIQGQKMYHKDVINVLLVGADSANGSASGRSDSIMLASLNKTTKQITLISFLRDSYTYMNIHGDPRYDKSNHAYAWAGPEALIEVLENNYKIKIDNYVCTDFSTFPMLIDKLGGVEVTVTEREANYLRYSKYRPKNPVPAGENVLLDGNQALMFSRIRKLDGDDHRARRQRDVISSIIRKMRQAPPGQLNEAIDILLPNIRTNYTGSQIFSLGTQALTGGWMHYEIASLIQPTEALRKPTYMYTWSQRSGNPLFVWIVDYPLAAREVQLALYGQTNITIDEEDHKSALGLLTPAPVRPTGGPAPTDPDDPDWDPGDDDDPTEPSEERTTSWLQGLLPTRPSTTEAPSTSETPSGSGAVTSTEAASTTRRGLLR